MTDAAVSAWLTDWLPAQRWFPGRGRRPARVDVLDAVTLDTSVTWWLLEVTGIAGVNGVTDGTGGTGGSDRTAPARFSVPLRHRDGAATAAWDCALTDDDTVRRLIALSTHGGSWQGRHGHILGVPVADARPAVDGAVAAVTGEQSNSTVVLAQRSGLKVLRRVQAGPHPDLELPRALAGQRPACTPAVQGALSYIDANGADTTLGVLTDWHPHAQSGWDLVTAAWAAGDRTRLEWAAAGIGAALARLHRALAETFDPQPWTAAQLAAWAADLRREVTATLRLGADAGADIGAVLRAAEAGAFALVDDLQDRSRSGRLDTLGVRQRIHGDCHLGQTLADAAPSVDDAREPTGTGWLFIDFEGEPDRPLACRREAAAPARDVAGLLRSFDYAAAVAAGGDHAAAVAAGGRDAHGTQTRERLRRRLVGAYRTEAGQHLGPPSTPAGDADWARLLAASELEKACYELRYELAHRPDWAAIPAQGILRVSRTRGTQR